MMCKKAKRKEIVPATPRPRRSVVQGTRRASAWRAEVTARVAELEDRLAAAPVDGTSAERQAIRNTVEAELALAYTAAERDRPAPLPAWWEGSSTTEAWEAVHHAEFSLLLIETDEAVLASVPRLMTWIQRVMDAGPLRDRHEKGLNAELEKGEGGIPDRVKIRGALDDVIGANSRRYAALRTFRNNLIMATLLLIALLLTGAIWHANDHHFLALCAKEKSGQLSECLSGENSGPGTGEIWLVLLLGALGGALGITFKLSESDEATRYDPKSWQRFLKPVTGAATALAAIIFIQSHPLVELTGENKTRVVYMGYALIFGFSQQLLTKFVDQRAESLMTPEKK